MNCLLNSPESLDKTLGRDKHASSGRQRERFQTPFRTLLHEEDTEGVEELATFVPSPILFIPT